MASDKNTHEGFLLLEQLAGYTAEAKQRLLEQPSELKLGDDDQRAELLEIAGEMAGEATATAAEVLAEHPGLHEKLGYLLWLAISTGTLVGEHQALELNRPRVITTHNELGRRKKVVDNNRQRPAENKAVVASLAAQLWTKFGEDVPISWVAVPVARQLLISEKTVRKYLSELESTPLQARKPGPRGSAVECQRRRKEVEQFQFDK